MAPGTPGTLRPNPYHEHAWIIGEPSIGAGTWIGAFTVIDGSGGLTIGVGCDIGCGTQIYTHSSAKRCVSGRRYPEIERAPVTIGVRVFIGAAVLVMMGVTIGDEAVVSPGSVVTRDVAARTVVAGVPARVVRAVEISDDGVPTFGPVAAPVPGPSPA